jgi:hypothetical protein
MYALKMPEGWTLSMAAGNTESTANGVTGVGDIHHKPAYLAIPTPIQESTRFIFYPLSPSLRWRCVPGCHFLFAQTPNVAKK